jgi:hypothetical protein
LTPISASYSESSEEAEEEDTEAEEEEEESSNIFAWCFFATGAAATARLTGFDSVFKGSDCGIEPASWATCIVLGFRTAMGSSSLESEGTEADCFDFETTACLRAAALDVFLRAADDSTSAEGSTCAADRFAASALLPVASES